MIVLPAYSAVCSACEDGAHGICEEPWFPWHEHDDLSSWVCCCFEGSDYPY